MVVNQELQFSVQSFLRERNYATVCREITHETEFGLEILKMKISSRLS